MFKTKKDMLFEAAAEGNRDEVRRLMEAGGFDANVKSSLWRGTPILAYAILNQDHDLAQHLIDRGADPGAESKSGVTPSSLIMQTFGMAQSADAWLREGATALTTSALAWFRAGADDSQHAVHSRSATPRM